MVSRKVVGDFFAILLIGFVILALESDRHVASLLRTRIRAPPELRPGSTLAVQHQNKMSHAFSCLQVLAAVTRAFSAVLAHMDRNAGIRLLNEEGLRARWISLFQVSPVGVTCHLYLGALDLTRFYYNVVF